MSEVIAAAQLDEQGNVNKRSIIFICLLLFSSYYS